MRWWQILICLVSIHKIIHLVRSQDDDDDNEDDDEEDELTTIPFLDTTNDVENQLNQGVSSLLPSLTVNNRLNNNGSESTINQINLNESSKQRIIVALAVLCAALVVILGFLVSIVVCQWLKHDRDDSIEGTHKTAQADSVGSSYNYHDHTYRQAIQL